MSDTLSETGRQAHAIAVQMAAQLGTTPPAPEAFVHVDDTPHQPQPPAPTVAAETAPLDDAATSILTQMASVAGVTLA